MKRSKGLLKYLLRIQDKYKMWGMFDDMYGRTKYHKIIKDIDKRLTELRK